MSKLRKEVQWEELSNSGDKPLREYEMTGWL